MKEVEDERQSARRTQQAGDAAVRFVEAFEPTAQPAGDAARPRNAVRQPPPDEQRGRGPADHAVMQRARHHTRPERQKRRRPQPRQRDQTDQPVDHHRVQRRGQPPAVAGQQIPARRVAGDHAGDEQIQIHPREIIGDERPQRLREPERAGQQPPLGGAQHLPRQIPGEDQPDHVEPHVAQLGGQPGYVHTVPQCQQQAGGQRQLEPARREKREQAEILWTDGQPRSGFDRLARQCGVVEMGDTVDALDARVAVRRDVDFAHAGITDLFDVAEPADVPSLAM